MARKPAKRKKAKTAKKKTISLIVLFRLKEGLLLLAGALAIFLLLALVTYHRTDPGWSYASAMPIQNATGIYGAYAADLLLSFLGFFGYLVPFLMILALWSIYRHIPKEDEKNLPLLIIRVIGALLTLASGSSLSSLLLARYADHLPQGAGGIIGQTLYQPLLSHLNYYGSLLTLVAILGLGLTLLAGISWIKLGNALILKIKTVIHLFLRGIAASLTAGFHHFKQKRMTRQAAKMAQQALLKQTEPSIDTKPYQPEPPPKPSSPPNIKMPAAHDVKKVSIPEAKNTTVDIDDTPKRMNHAFDIPSIDLLDPVQHSDANVSQEALQEMAQMVEAKLTEFSITAKVVGICPGPIVTRYELALAPGLKVSKLSGLSKDLARSLSATSVRIVEVIPGKSVVGLEIPNEKRDIVRLKEILQTNTFLKSRSPLVVGLGKDVAGHEEMADLAKMPHLLVAGTTGSGKSVGVNAMILSMLLKATPDELRLIMIDPKMLELSIYEGIPHLLTPVVTDMKEASNALRWCVKEMDRRYKLMANLGVRNLLGFNEKIKAAAQKGTPIKDPLFESDVDTDQPDLTTLPYIVVVIDEFADMMMVVGKKVEELIARIAQKARAAGIHLVLATQRPSVDVITGLIKANIPSRIAFQVSSKIDSRTILDQMGAEQLLGHGDMLFLPPGTSIPNRIHGAFVADHEVHAVANAWKAQGEPHYIASILQEESSENNVENADKDVLFDEAVKIVLDSQRASISGIQRRLKIGYNRAARLVEQMEDAGVVGPMQTNGMRDILIHHPQGES